MRNSADVIAQVVNGHGPKLAEILEVSPSRCYEILSTDNPYPKTKRLIRSIAQVAGCDIGLIKADLDSMWQELLCDDVPNGSIKDCHKQSSEGVQADLEELPLPEQLKEAREAMASWASRVRYLERQMETPREIAKQAVHGRNGRG